jgi:hypothetical protein
VETPHGKINKAEIPDNLSFAILIRTFEKEKGQSRFAYIGLFEIK